MLSSASLASRFRPNAFYHFRQLHNMNIYGDHVKTLYELCSGPKLDLSRVRTFGCRAYVELPRPRPRPRRRAKFEIDARTGIFHGYAHTLKNPLYFDLDSHEVKSAQHTRYDKGVNDVPDPPPNAR
jgi:hypothetical protein